MTVPAVVVERAAEATMSETVRCDAPGCQNTGKRRMGWIAPEGWKFIEIGDDAGGSPIVGAYCSLACAVSVIQDARKMGPEESAAMREESDEESEVDAEYRADHIGKALDERARRLPKTFLDPVAVADLVHWIATGEVRGYSAAEDEERARSVVDQIHRTGQWSYYAPRLLKGK